MKKILAFLGIILFVTIGCSDEQQSDHDHFVMRKQYFEPGSEEPFNGERIFYYDSGEIKRRAIYVDGYPEIVTYFDRNQNKRSKMLFEKDGMIGYTVWYSSGQKKTESTSKSMSEWYENGQLKAEANFDEDHNLHGITKVWYQDGTLKGMEEYNHSKLDGERIKWNQTGEKILTETYKQGELISSSES